ncbi:MAG: precorrin-6Y C5,15-methyltransferase (decarboxylating) subunit CbiT [Lachnospiraceae bacterium]|nr:precorrin-6Y C5,15-methyltransferase (decarboxylating) subunit CbiT [Lachnospiraceae bacterium]
MVKEGSLKQIKVIGIGMGDEVSMTVAARDWIAGCDLLIGASRMVQAAAAIAISPKYVIAWQPKDVRDAIRQSEAEKIAVLMSGDIGFFSGARALREELESEIKNTDMETGAGAMTNVNAGNLTGVLYGEYRNKQTSTNADTGNATGVAGNQAGAQGVNRFEYEISWLPGISSLSYFCNAIGIPYEDAFMLSIHGRGSSYVRQIAIHEKTFLLSDGDLPEFGKKLVSYGMGNVTVWVGMDLAAPTQRIFKTTPEELSQFAKEDCRPLTVCLILNPDAEKWRNPYRRDEEFFRDGKTPMTKEEVRGVVLGKLAPESRDVIYDIGGGSGSVSVACAIAASGGTVYSIECDAEAAKLIDKNRRRFACDNIEIIAGRAPEALRELPAPNRVFIGGSGGGLAEILTELEEKLRLRKTRVVISSITLETNAAVSSYIHTSPHVKNAEVCQIAVTKSKAAGGSTLMMGQNPVMIFSFDLKK